MIPDKPDKVVPFRKGAPAPVAQQQNGQQVEVVALIGCGGCGSSTFNLAHDQRVLCACCHTHIVGLHWGPDMPPKPAA